MTRLLFVLTGFLASALGLAVLEPSKVKIPADYGRYAVFWDEATDTKIELFAQYQVAPAQLITINSDTIQAEFSAQRQTRPAFTRRPKVPTGLAIRRPTELATRQGVCERIADCYNNVAETATAGAIFIANVTAAKCLNIWYAILNYFSANDYQNVGLILQQFVVGLIVNFVSTPIGDAIINSLHKLAKDPDGATCSKTERSVLAYDFADMQYAFCMSIQAARTTIDIPNHFYAGDVPAPGQTNGGDVAVAQHFIASHGGLWGPVCAKYGIYFRRSMGFEHGASYIDEKRSIPELT